MKGGHSIRSFAVLAAVLLATGLLAACGSSAEGGSGQFRNKTDSARLDFGEESGGAELDAGAEAVEAFLASRARGDWSEACAQLSRAMLAKIEHLAVSATDLEDKSCPSFLSTFTRLSTKEREESKVVDAGSLRQQGRHGFLIYYGAGEVVYAMPLSREGDDWKVASLAPERLS